MGGLAGSGWIDGLRLVSVGLCEAPALIADEAERIDARHSQGRAYRGYLRLGVCPAFLLGDDGQASDLGSGNDERICSIAVLCRLHKKRVLGEDFARCALNSVVKRDEQMRTRVDPLGEVVLLPLQLDAHLVGTEHLLLSDEFVQLDPKAGKDVGRI